MGEATLALTARVAPTSRKPRIATSAVGDLVGVAGRHKRVDVAVFDAMSAGADLETGVKVLGLAEDGVGWALDENNAELVSDDMKAAIEDAKSKIIAGEISVHDYSSDDSCPALTF